MPHTLDVTLPSDREIRVTRTFDAPRALVFACHTEPDLVRRWLLGPAGWSMPVCDIDLREGGRYRYVWRSDADGSEFGFRGEFREIVAPERVVHTERLDGAEGAEGAEGAGMGESLCTLTLVERDGRTTLTQTMRFDTMAVRAQALQTGMTDGMGASDDRLEREILRQPVG